ncbi:hypothetical protein C8R44DRAFT_700019 [Mycena epipterygia]|nr:hypothetical protein C8R44DRAFT_700019 [Mycena epipterygia]
MLSAFQIGFFALSLISASQPVLGRERWLERGGRAIQLNPRRFGQEHPPVIDRLSAACGGGICATLAGGAITPLLAAQPECSQQDFADKIIQTSLQFDAATQVTMLALAIEYRQAEKNTPPDFTTNPPTARNSVFCQKAPANAALNGLVQAQDPANGPDIFFDPATGKSVKLGAQTNTLPFGGKASSNVTAISTSSTSAATVTAAATTNAATATEPCTTATVTVTATTTDCPSPTTVTVTATAAAVTTSAATSTGSTSAIGNFGKCSLPEIKFAVGFDGRKETSFEPVDLTSYPHTSAQNVDIITQFICDTLVNSCGADATAKATCASARAAVDTVTPKIGLQADTFNKFFGKVTNFAAVAAVDNQGNVIAGTAN